MTTNETVGKGSLPIVSKEEKVKNNCMKLFTYLTTISTLDYDNVESRRKGRRQFQQKDFTLNKIHTVLGLDAKTIKKYWKQLEDDGLIKYAGAARYQYNYELSWDKNFMLRKKYPEGYYHIDRPEKFRKIPKETIDKILNEYFVSELELKIYLLLGNMQELYYAQGVSKVDFTYKDMINLLGLKNEKQNRVAIRKAIVWLGQIGLVDFLFSKKKAGNFNFDVECFTLQQVNFYVEDKMKDDGKDTELLSQEDKEKILEMSLL